MFWPLDFYLLIYWVCSKTGGEKRGGTGTAAMNARGEIRIFSLGTSELQHPQELLRATIDKPGMEENVSSILKQRSSAFNI